MARVALFFLLFACVAWCQPARASGDFGCSPSWKLAHGMRSDCDDMAMIGPGNDSRTNLMLFMADLPGATIPRAWAASDKPLVFLDWESLALRPDGDSLYSDGEGSRCLGNAAGIASFEAALAVSKMRESERNALGAARRRLQPDCAQDGTADPSIAAAVRAIKSGAGRAFADYL
jgi:hypothetical protein